MAHQHDHGFNWPLMLMVVTGIGAWLIIFAFVYFVYTGIRYWV